MKNGQFYAHGDLLVIKVSDEVLNGGSAIKSDVPGRTVLAYGEVTGHHHSIDESVSRLFEVSGIGSVPKIGAYNREEKGDTVLVIDALTTLVHQEHAPWELPVGSYIVRQQVTLEAGDIRVVRD